MNEIKYNLDGKVIIVTGGSKGIGLAITKSLIRENARVVICGRKKDNLDSAVQELNGGDNLLAVQAHVGKPEDVDALFDATLKKFGRLDILINNVGMNLPTGPIADMDIAAWNKIIETNLTGNFLCSRKAAGILRELKSGKIISLSSVAGRKVFIGMGIYGVAKAGLEMLTRVLAYELAPYNVQVNAVAPGVVKTDFSKPFWTNEAVLGQIESSVPAGRIADVDDVVHPVLFLCSDASNYITGEVIMVDGGATI
jgi:NAD(P)-dependent dehydrogenase (short-subunit alcohol dehydrogenase family)